VSITDLDLWTLGWVGLAMGLLWMLSLLMRDVSIVDVFWGIGFILIAVASGRHEGSGARQGIVLVLLSDDVFEFSDVWISLSFLLYITALGVSHGLHQPNLRALVALQGAVGPGGPTPEQGRELEERGKKAGMFGGILHLLLVVLLWLMIFKPGWP